MGQEEQNKKLVLEYEDLTFNKKDVNAAVAYLHDNFVQHNPQIPDGKQGFIDGVGGYLLKQNPNIKITIKRVIASGDFVVLHAFGKFDDTNPGERGVSIMDIFRIADGKIIEHWDAIEPIPEQSANTNTMF
jgi:predicted SnoaL-like aldol condensation-catalyzing enzyme